MNFFVCNHDKVHLSASLGQSDESEIEFPGPDLGQGRLGVCPGAVAKKGPHQMELRDAPLPPAPEKRRLAAHFTPKYILPRGPHSLKSGPVQTVPFTPDDWRLVLTCDMKMEAPMKAGDRVRIARPSFHEMTRLVMTPTMADVDSCTKLAAFSPIASLITWMFLQQNQNQNTFCSIYISGPQTLACGPNLARGAYSFCSGIIKQCLNVPCVFLA